MQNRDIAITTAALRWQFQLRDLGRHDCDLVYFGDIMRMVGEACYSWEIVKCGALFTFMDGSEMEITERGISIPIPRKDRNNGG